MTTAVNNAPRKLKVTIKRMNVDSKCVDDGQRYQVTQHVEFKTPGTKKRSPETCLVSPKKKVQKMDRIVKLQCGNLLKELMRHPSGWIFGEPVDPVKWNIPDYFSVIKRPMDLGTVNNKLEKYLYSSVGEFAADVRLTFSNAILYNPPSDDVHKVAKFLDGIFEKKWKSLEAKLKGEKISASKYDGEVVQSVERSCVDDKKEVVNRDPICSKFGDKTMSMEGRQKVVQSVERSCVDDRKEVVSRGPVCSKFGNKTMSMEGRQKVMQSVERRCVDDRKEVVSRVPVCSKFGDKTMSMEGRQKVVQSVERSCVDDKKEVVSRGPVCSNFGNKTMSMEGRQKVRMLVEDKLKLKSEVIEVLNGKMTEKLSAVFKKFGLAGLQVKKLQSYIDATDDEILWKLKKEIKISIDDAKTGKVTPVKTVKVGSQFLGKVDLKDTKLKAKCILCGTFTCHCWEKKAPRQAFSSDLSSVKQNHFGDSRLDAASKCSSTLENRSGTKSDGRGVVSSGSPHLSVPSLAAASVEGSTPTTSASGEGCTTCDIQMSPKRALRVAMLKSRFANTIYKATHQVDKSDPTTMQQETERLEKQQLEEKARIEKEIKATEEAMQKQLQAEVIMKREKEREAARMALRKLERSVEIYDSQEIWRDLQRLCWSPDAVKNPLEKLGLRRKDDFCDYFEEDDAFMFELEEGEIIS